MSIDLGDPRVTEPLEAEAAPRPLVPDASASSLRRSAWWWIRAAMATVTILAGYEILVVLGGFVGAVLTVVLYLVFGAILSFLAAPVVDALVRYARVPRTVAILSVLGGGLLLLGLAVYLAASPTVSEAQQLAGKVPDFVNRAANELRSWQRQLASRGINVNGLDPGSWSGDLTRRLSDILLAGITSTVQALLDILIVFVVAFWLLKDGERLRAGFLSLLPSKVRVNVEFGLDSVGVVIGGYVRAQLVLAVIIGALAGIGCALLGVPFPIVVALAAGIFELIPIVGPFVGGAVAILLALTVSPTLAVLTLILFIGIHIVEGYVLAPRIQARFVQLHPLVSLLALFTGIEVRGFLGAMFAVPLASLLAVYVRAAVGDFRASRPELYATRRVDLYSERRRQTILREFRFFKRSPIAMLRSGLRRVAGRSGVPPAAGRPVTTPPGGPEPVTPATPPPDTAGGGGHGS